MALSTVGQGDHSGTCIGQSQRRTAPTFCEREQCSKFVLSAPLYTAYSVNTRGFIGVAGAREVGMAAV